MRERNSKLYYLPVVLFVLLALLSMAAIVTAETNEEKEAREHQQAKEKQEKKQKELQEKKLKLEQEKKLKLEQEKKLKLEQQQKTGQPPQQKTGQQPEQPGGQQQQEKQKPVRPLPLHDPGPTGASPSNDSTVRPNAFGRKPVNATGPKMDDSNPMKPTPGPVRKFRQVEPVYKLPPDLKAGQGNSAVLPKAHGDAILHQVNSARTNMRGVNARHLPTGQVLVHQDGGLIIKASRGRDYKVRADGTLASFSERGRTGNFGNDGKLRSLHANGMDIVRGPHNERRIVTVRPDNSVLVSTGPHSGYLQRTVVRNNQPVIQRTYVEKNVSYTRVYSSYTYGGVVMQQYLPETNFTPTFYKWAYNPWRTPVRYAWGWQQDPWYGYYNGYFVPAPVYPNSALWLTDYLLGETLRSAYLARGLTSATGPSAYIPADSPIPPELRDMIALGIKKQLAREREATRYPDQAVDYGGLPAAIRDPNHLFIVSDNIEVTGDEQVCNLTAGDVLRLTGTPPEGVMTADLRVASSQRGDCPAGSVATIALNDLQEMHNRMRERIYDGLELLRQRNGYSGLPAPPMGIIPPPRVNEAAAPADNSRNVLDMLQAQQSEADQSEAQVIQAAFNEDHGSGQ